jgi:hypothetical protein
MATEEEEAFVNGTKNFAAARHAEIEQQAAKGDKSAIWDTFNSLLFTITNQYSTSDIPTSVIEEEIHLLWFILIQAAKHLSPNSLGQLSMVQNVLQAREFGALTRTIEIKKTVSKVQEVAETKDGRMWVDLPFLFEDLEAEWTADRGALNEAQQRNFTSFLAKLLALGVCWSEIAGLALSTINRALEDEHLLLEFQAPLACMWFEKAGDKLVSLCNASFQSPKADLNTIGPLARKAGVSSEGFSPGRWLFWMERMKQFSLGDNEELAKLGVYGYLNMHRLIWRTDCAMRPTGLGNDEADKEMCIAVLEPFCQKWPALAEPEWLPYIEAMKALY